MGCIASNAALLLCVECKTRRIEAHRVHPEDLCIITCKGTGCKKIVYHGSSCCDPGVYYCPKCGAKNNKKMMCGACGKQLPVPESAK